MGDAPTTIHTPTTLTHSALATYKTCPRKYYLRYECRLSPQRDADYFRLGSAYHRGQEILATTGGDLDAAIAAVHDNYANPPEWVTSDPDAMQRWYYEAVTVECLLRGYVWRWQAEALTPIAAEMVFDLPLTNPETGASTPNYRHGGMIDQIVSLPDTRVAVLEFKTTAFDLSPESDYWARLRLDHQISNYYLAATQAMEMTIDTVLYDVTRKPTIRPNAVPVLDAEGLKVVVDSTGERVWRKDGKAPKQTADAAAGEKLQTRPMNLEEWAAKLMTDIYARPEYYYARAEVPRLASDIEEYRDELWQQQQQLRASETKGRWFRNTAACIGYTRCEYFAACTSGRPLSDLQDENLPAPAGYERRASRHPELTQEKPR